MVVGKGMAGMRTVEELVARAPDRFDIAVIGGEPHLSYNCILLSSVLAGEVAAVQRAQAAGGFSRADCRWLGTNTSQLYADVRLMAR